MPNNQSLIEVVFPTKANAIFYSAISTGIIMLLISFLIRHYRFELRVESNIILCFGLAIIGAAFGAQATVSVGRFVIAGAAAIAVALFWIVEDRAEKKAATDLKLMTSSYVRGKIREAKPNIFLGMTMDPDVEFVGNLYPTGNVYQFALFGDLPDTRTVTMFLNDGGENSKDFVVHRTCLEKYKNQLRTVEWKMTSEIVIEGEASVRVPAIYDMKENSIIAVHSATARTVACEQQEAHNTNKHLGFDEILSVSNAYAQSFAKDEVPAKTQLDEALVDLTNPNSAVRQNARSVLSLAPDSFIPEILGAMKSTGSEHPDNYRLVLGGSTALTLALRRDKSRAAEIRALLQNDDLNLLLDAASHKDRTMRIYATEFLYDLADPRVTVEALKRASDTHNETARYNWILASQGGWHLLDQGAQDKLALEIENLMSSSGPQTKKLLEWFAKN